MTNQLSAPDKALEILVSLANGQTKPSPEGGFGVTLHVRGSVVTGRLVPNWQWMEEVAEKMQAAYLELEGEAPEPDARLGETVLFDHLATEMKEMQAADKKLRAVADQLSDEQVRGAAQAQQIAFIHLVDARFISGGQIIPEAGAHWRGRLAEIDGWSPGNLKRS